MRLFRWAQVCSPTLFEVQKVPSKIFFVRIWKTSTLKCWLNTYFQKCWERCLGYFWGNERRKFFSSLRYSYLFLAVRLKHKVALKIFIALLTPCKTFGTEITTKNKQTLSIHNNVQTHELWGTHMNSHGQLELCPYEPGSVCRKMKFCFARESLISFFQIFSKRQNRTKTCIDKYNEVFSQFLKNSTRK